MISLSLFSFSSFYLPQSKPQKLKRLIDSRTFQSYFKLYSGRISVSREYVCKEFDCRRISVIVHRSGGDKLAIVHSSCLFGAESYSGQRERKSVSQGFQSKICELVSGKLSKCLYSYFEKGCRKKCTRQSRKVLWVVLSLLFFKEI